MNSVPASASRPLKVAVVGHTNTGKTSLMRTLTRDESFGEVSNRPATTRHVEGATLMVGGRSAVELYDTPGLEDSIGLLEFLERRWGNRRMDGIDQIRELLSAVNAGEEDAAKFAQEAKALRQVLDSDVALYVIDARDRVLGKHRDELDVLSRCARPVVPVLNFVASPEAQVAVWREHLSRANLHAVAEFDTVVLDDDTERRLLEKMRTLLDDHQHTLTKLIEERSRIRAGLVTSSCRMIADLLIDVAAHHDRVPANDRAQVERAMEHMRERIRRREQRCVEQLLQLHRFSADDLASSDLPLIDGRWGIDLFSPAALKQAGIRTGGAVAAGAVAGLTIDAMVGGLTLGAATALGAAVGGAVGLAHAHGRRMLDRLRGYSELAADTKIVHLLLARQIALLRTLLRRGHASLQPIRVEVADQPGGRGANDQIDQLVDEIRLRPNFSRMGDSPAAMPWNEASRESVQAKLAVAIEARLRRP